MTWIVLDTIGAWVTTVIVLVHAIAFRNEALRKRGPSLVVHAVACVGMALAHHMVVFVGFSALAFVPLLRLFESEERRDLMVDLGVALACLIAATVTYELGLHAFVVPALLVGFAARVGLFPFGRWLDAHAMRGREAHVALLLGGATAWIGFVRHLPVGAFSELGHTEIIAGIFATSGLIMAIAAGRSAMPVAEFARAHVAVAIAGGLLFMGPRLIFDYAFAALVATSAIFVVLAGNPEHHGEAYALPRHDRWLLAFLVVVCVGCPATALFVDEDLTLDGISFAHPLIAAAIGVIYVAASVALMRFFFERARSTEAYYGKRATWLVPALLSLALILWGIAPHLLDPSSADDIVTPVSTVD